MDTVFEYKKDLCNYLNSMNDDDVILITLDQFFYLILSSSPNDSVSLLDVTKKILSVVKTNKASSSVRGLKKLFNYSEQCGLSEFINTEIYNLLLIHQLIIKNEDLLKNQYDESLFKMNNELISNYNIKKQNLINTILQQ